MNDEAHRMAVVALALHGQRSHDVFPPSSLVDLHSDHIQVARHCTRGSPIHPTLPNNMYKVLMVQGPIQYDGLAGFKTLLVRYASGSLPIKWEALEWLTKHKYAKL
jgi:hypothetical protein